MKKTHVYLLLLILNALVFTLFGYSLSRNSEKLNIFKTADDMKREELSAIIGIKPWEKRLIPDVKVIDEADEGDSVIRKKIILTLENIYAADSDSPAKRKLKARGLIFHPAAGSPPYPAVLVYHGHGEGVMDTSITSDAYDLCRALAGAGYLAMTISLTDIELSIGYKNHATASRAMMLQGRSVMSAYVYAGVRCLDYLTFIDLADRDALGAAGESMGGHAAVITAAIDGRVKSVADASYLVSYSFFPHDPEICTCNYVPGTLPEHDFVRTAALIAPRNVLYMVGKKDELCPWEVSRKLFDDFIKPVYAAAGRADAAALYLHDGGHGMQIEKTVEWFRKTLKPKREEGRGERGEGRGKSENTGDTVQGSGE